MCMNANNNNNKYIGDYYRFGNLLIRLGLKHEATEVWSSIFKNSKFSLRIALRLMEIYSLDGFVEETLNIIDSVVSFYNISCVSILDLDISQTIGNIHQTRFSLTH